MIVKFDWKGLGLLDGERLKLAVEQALATAISDLDDRPGEKRARSVTLKIDAIPVPDDINDLDTANISWSIAVSLPKRKSRNYQMKARKSSDGPMLVFNEDSLDDPHNPTLFDQEQKDNERDD